MTICHFDMNATLLYHQDGNPSGLAYCGKCRIVHRDTNAAEQCCKPNVCTCGRECRTYYTACDACMDAARLKREEELFEKAEKVTTWTGPILAEGMGWRDGYFMDVGELEDWLEEEERERPKYVWTCDCVGFVNVDLDSIIDRMTDNAYEEWNSDCLKGTKELEAAIQKFNEANKDQVAWHPNYKRALLI